MVTVSQTEDIGGSAGASGGGCLVVRSSTYMQTSPSLIGNEINRPDHEAFIRMNHLAMHSFVLFAVNSSREGNKQTQFVPFIQWTFIVC